MGNLTNSTLKRHKPLRAKKPYWKRSKRPQGHLIAPSEKPFRKVSKKREKQQQEYWLLRKAFLSKQQNRWCIICICRATGHTWSEVKEVLAMPQKDGDTLLALSGAILTPATETHHRAGRIGRLLTYEPYLIPSCKGCRDFPHTFPSKARAFDILASPADWNRMPQG